MNKLSEFHFKIILFVAVAFNLLLRLYKIDLSPLSYDESITVKDTLLDFGHIKHEAEWDSNPPFYHYCMWVWAQLFGISEFALRSFSAVISSLTMLIGALFLKKNYSAITSLIFIILFTVHPVIFYYSQEARSYSLILLLGCVTFICFKKFLETPNLTLAITLGILNFLLIYTHYLTFYIPLFQTVIVIFIQRHAIKWFSVSAILSLILAFTRFTKGQIELILGTSPKASSRAWLKKANFNDLYEFITKMYLHYLLFIFIICTLCYFVYTNRNSIKNKQFYFLLSLSLFVPLIHFIIGLFTPIFVDRYILYSVFFTIFFLSISANYIKIAFLPFFGLALFSAYQLKPTYKKDFDLKSVANYVHSHQGNRQVIIHTSDLNGLFTYYYDRNEYLRMSKEGGFDLQNKNIFTARDLEDFKHLPIDYNKDIMLFQGFDNESINKEIYEYFKMKGYSLLAVNGFHGLKFTVFSK